jgi:hypothetical protein
MTDILSSLMGQLGPSAIQQISQQLGAPEGATQSAVQAALPALMTALANNAQTPQGAQALGGALERDHDGSILDNIGGFLGGGTAASAGASILGHVLGQKQAPVAQSIGGATGLDAGQSTQLLSMLAPLVLGALGKQQRQQGLDAGGIAKTLAGTRQQAQEASPVMGMLTQLLDKDGDGSAADELAATGLGMLSSFLKK